jgi:hypothetical protein
MDEKTSLFGREFKEKLSLDARFTVFDVTESEKNKNVFVQVVCSEKHLDGAIRKYFKLFFDNSPAIKLKLNFLPDKALLYKYGIANSGVCPLYSKASNKSEQTNQIIIGETFDLLEVSDNDEWFRVRLHKDGYIGWVNKNPVKLIGEKELVRFYKSEKVEIIKKFADIYSFPDKKSFVLRGIFLGVELPVTGRKKNWVEVMLPDGSNGWLNEKTCRILEEDLENHRDLLKYAEMLFGVPYIWGGRSSFGIDCSSFTQLVYKMCGYQLPRDSNLQIKVGVEIGKDFSNFKIGDLLFFGNKEGRVTHVGMFTGEGMDFIHSSGFVRINSLDKKSRLFDERLSKMFFGARRIINL